ncbi:sensor histidine kinase [Actinomadura fibrosa]|uniref:Sensor histidine kinase n=1 Tax=Actinomadura fibrosa TaxID=111802 RepID=A0ABW2XWL6_9ACTN
MLAGEEAAEDCRCAIVFSVAGTAALTAASTAALAWTVCPYVRRLPARDRPRRLPVRDARVLHDTVLTTLTAIARGGLDHRAAEVRARCARDADRLRRMLTGAAPADRGGPADRLAAVAATAEALGLRVHLRQDALPALPAPLADAMAGAAGEALNNVLRHSGAREAWLTVSCDARTVVLRVVDRGAGFDPSSVRAGFGLRHSIAGRARETGGRLRVTSAPGEGTCVEVAWTL